MNLTCKSDFHIFSRHLSFSEVPIHYPEYPLQFPIRDYDPNDPTKSDPSFIGIFYSRCKIGELSGNEEEDYAKKRPGVYFRYYAYF